MGILENIARVKQHILQLESIFQRAPGSVQLLAVSKGQHVEAIQTAYLGGLQQFGENYWQELREKKKQLVELPIIWHFIGRIQSNKAGEIAKEVDWIHSVDREKIAVLLNHHRPDNLAPINICIQVDIDNEISKGGVAISDLSVLVSRIIKLPKLKLCGLMAIPRPHKNAKDQYLSFLHLAKLMTNLNLQFNLSLHMLSMGMSDDLEPAIKAGSTMVRIGTALFGPRNF